MLRSTVTNGLGGAASSDSTTSLFCVAAVSVDTSIMLLSAPSFTGATTNRSPASALFRFLAGFMFDGGLAILRLEFADGALDAVDASLFRLANVADDVFGFLFAERTVEEGIADLEKGLSRKVLEELSCVADM